MPQTCPRCGASNSETQRFCGECGAPFSSSTDVGAERTLTIDTSLTEWLSPGSLFAGKYQVIRQIGRGGMGIVYEAQDVKLKRAVALKLLPGELLADSLARERFIH